MIRSCLRELMEARKLTAPQLSTLANVPLMNVYHLMRDPERVHLPTLARISHALDVPISAILVDDEAEPPRASPCRLASA